MAIPTVEIAIETGTAQPAGGNGQPGPVIRPQAAAVPEEKPSEPAAPPEQAKEAAPTDTAVAETSTPGVAPNITPSVAPAQEAGATLPSETAGAAGPGQTAGSTQTSLSEPTGDGTPSGTGTGTATGIGTGTGEVGTGTDAAGAGAATEATGFLTPRPLADIQPLYPRAARKAGWEGVVRISALVDDTGVVISAKIVTSSGHTTLDQAALEAVRRTVFAPARQSGKAVSCLVIIPIRFQLN
ncbi:MAG: TonB family protein [Spirochaetia bacterium]